MTDHNEDVLLHQEGSVAWVTLNRPDRLNAVTPDMLDTLAFSLREIATNDEISVTVIRGAGRAFCAGGDLAHITEAAHSVIAADEATLLHSRSLLVEQIQRMPQFTIAAVKGACAGLGIGLAGACDLRIGSPSSVLNTAYLRLGVSGDFGVSWLLTQLLGRAVATDWMLRPRKIRAPELLARGFITEIVDSADFDVELTELAARLALVPPLTRRNLKANLATATTLPLAPYLELEAARHVQSKGVK